jgi:hypothetical protein
MMVEMTAMGLPGAQGGVGQRRNKTRRGDVRKGFCTCAMSQAKLFPLRELVAGELAKLTGPTFTAGFPQESASAVQRARPRCAIFYEQRA